MTIRLCSRGDGGSVPEQVDTFPRRTKANALWDEVADGAVWKLSPAEVTAHYASVKSAIASVRYYARLRGAKVKTMAHDGDLYVQFTGLGQDDELEARRQREQSLPER
jgi:hypothetical protein